MYRTRSFFALAFAAASLSAAQPAGAQSFFMPSTPQKGVWMEASYSDFKAADVSFPTTVWYLSGRLPVNERLRAVVDLPFSHARLDLFDTGEEESSSVIGNPYLGAEFAASRRLLLEVGLRAPLTTADEQSFADMLAFVADPLRAEAFVENMVPVSGAVSFEQALPSGLGVRARGGVTALFHSAEEESGTDAALDYGLVGTYTAGIARLGLGVSGRWFATNDEGSFAQNSLHYAGLTAGARLGGMRPGVSVRVPLDQDYRNLLGSTVGLYLQVPLR